MAVSTRAELMTHLDDSIRALTVCPKEDDDGFEVMQTGILVRET